MNAQAELFEKSDRPAPAQCAKLFRGANGVELPYWEEGGKLVRIELSDKLVLPVTTQKGGHIYANDPGGWGRIEKKSKTSFLSAAAQIRKAIQINESIQREAKEQHQLLCAASAIRPVAPAVGGRKRDATADFSQREFGPVITSFHGIEEYPLGTPSCLARREELEWSRKALYGQLRRWFGVLRTGCTVIKSNERLGNQVGLSRKAVGDGLGELERLRLIHAEGPAKGTRYIYFHWHEWMDSPDAIPTWAKLGQVSQDAWADLKQPMGEVEPTSCAKFGHKETSNNDQNKERLLAPDGERELLGKIAAIVGPIEMQKNGGSWRNRMRGGPLYVKALRYAVEDWKLRTPDQRRAIRNPAAWLIDRFTRALVEIEKAQTPAPAA